MEVKIARTAGFCWGVRRTVEKVMEVADQRRGRPVVTLGPIIHNPQAVARFEEKGIGIAGAVADVSDGTTTVTSPVGDVPVAADEPPCITGTNPVAGSYVVDRTEF